MQGTAPEERELLVFITGFHVIAVKENGLGKGFSDQWSQTSDERSTPRCCTDGEVDRGLFMSSFGFGGQFCSILSDSLKFLHYRVTQFVRSGAGGRTDFKYTAVPLQLFKQHFFGHGLIFL